MTARAPKQPAPQRRQSILDGAAEVFAGASYQAADTADLATAAGVKPAALYRYFPGKRQLYLEVLEAASRRLGVLWEEAASEAPNAWDALWDIGMSYYDHGQSRREVMALWFRAFSEVSDPRVRETIAGSFLRAVGFIQETIEDGQRRETVRDDIDARVAAWHFMTIGLTFDLLEFLGLGRELDREKVEAWGRLYMDSIRATTTAEERT